MTKCKLKEKSYVDETWSLHTVRDIHTLRDRVREKNEFILIYRVQYIHSSLPHHQMPMIITKQSEKGHRRFSVYTQ